MKTLLRIDCSSRLTGSHSRALADYFEENWKAVNTNGSVVYRDLTKNQLPHIQNSTIEGFYMPIEHLSPAHKEALTLSDELIAELIQADEILISSPLYNLNIPSNLKAYLDQTVRVGHTFSINENGYYGLLKDKTAYIITVKGGIYKGTFMEQYDFQVPYLKAILNHIGIEDQEFFSLEGTSDSNIIEQNKDLLQNAIHQHFKKMT